MDGQQNTQNPPQQESIETKRQSVLTAIATICGQAGIGSPALRALKDIKEIYEIVVMDAEVQMQEDSDLPSEERITCSIAQNQLSHEINDRRIMMPGYAKAYDALLMQGELLLNIENERFQMNPDKDRQIIPPQAVANELAHMIEEKIATQ